MDSRGIFDNTIEIRSINDEPNPNFQRSGKRKKTWNSSLEMCSQRQNKKSCDTIDHSNSQHISDKLPHFTKVEENYLPTQFFNDSLVMSEIENVIDSHTSTKEELDDLNQGRTKKELADTPLVQKQNAVNNKFASKEFNKTLSEILSTNEIDVIFDEIETSIYQMGIPQSNRTIGQEVLEIICSNGSQTQMEQEELNGDKSLMNISSFNLSFGTIFKNKLLANASKNSNPKEEILHISEEKKVTPFQELGPYYGLPMKVKDLIKLYKGIDDLYDWQDECLNLPAVIQKRNLIYALPTSGGKTLVAEILILRELLCLKKNAIFILPFVALVQEKVWTMSPFAVALDFLIEEYAGSKGIYPPRKRRRKNSVFIATIEKALGLINSLIETDRINEIGLIVVDELHLLGEPGRGPTLEALLTKLVVTKACVQIIGMSATIGNLEDICTFLNAENYTKNFRPVELTEYIKCGSQIAKINLMADEDQMFSPERNVEFNIPLQNFVTLSGELSMCYSGPIVFFTPNGLSRGLPFLLSKNPYSGKNVIDLEGKISPPSLIETFAFFTSERDAISHYAPAVKIIDPDQLGGLVMEVVPKGSCLIFCASKKNCENVAKLLSRIIFKTLKEYKTQEKNLLVEALIGETGTLCNTLKFSIPFGVAYHHSGLTTEERRIIEDGFRAGVISVICCTSTLAAGVNLPAKRVILRSPYIGRAFINLSRYKQMIGRAGRAGLGEQGESILMCSEQDLPKVMQLLKSPMDKALSTIYENDGKGLRHLLLSCIALGIANTRTEIQEVTKRTLWAVQNENKDELKKFTDKIIKDLFNLGALQTNNHETNAEKAALNLSMKLETTMNTEDSIESQNIEKSKKKHLLIQRNTKLVVSKMGLAAIKGGLELSKAHILYEDLVQAQYSLVLLDALHLLYLVTPYDLCEQIKPDKNVYFTLFQRLPEKELHTAKVLGITESVAVKMISNQTIKNVPIRVLNRFYLTLILYDLWNEMPIFEAAEKYRVDRGLVQNLMQSSSTFSSNVVNFCQELEEFWPFAHLLKGMSLRLSHCCTRELMPLMELPAVKQNRAKQLYNAGYKTLHSIAKANVDVLTRDIEYLSKQVAVQLISAAKMLLLEKVENLREEAEDVLNGVENSNQFTLSLMH